MIGGMTRRSLTSLLLFKFASIPVPSYKYPPLNIGLPWKAQSGGYFGGIFLLGACLFAFFYFMRILVCYTTRETLLGRLRVDS